MTYSKSKIKKLTTALEIYSQLTANKYKETEIQDVEFSSIFEKKMEKLINRQKKPYFYLINTVAKRIAIIIAVIIIALTSTALSVDALREGVKNFFVETFEKFSSVFFNESENTLYAIEKRYNPDFLPEGFILSDVYADEVTHKVKYNDDYGNEILYIQSIVSNGFNIDNGNGNIEEINNGVYVDQTDNNIKMYFWSDGEYKFALHAFGDISKEELLKIAESIKNRSE